MAVRRVLELKRKGYQHVLDADIQGFFNNIPHHVIMNGVCELVADGNILRLVEQFLRAGVIEDGVFTSTDVGTPQGGVISPLLANITLKLERKDLLPHLIDVLEKPDPRAPQTQDTNGKKVSVVRELVRVNHHHHCLLCHAPATASRDKSSKEETDKLEGLTAQVPVPSEAMVAYYRPSSPDILVRFDVTCLRQDFSMKLPVADADPWPELQRYDFLVRTRAVTAQEAVAYQELLQPALSALRELTGRTRSRRPRRGAS